MKLNLTKKLKPWAWAYSTFHPSMVGKSSTSLFGWGEGGVRSLVSGGR